MPKQDKKIRVECTVVVAPTTKKAFLASFKDSEGDILGETWLPYSQVKRVINGSGGFAIEGSERGMDITIEMPQWLAEKEAVEELIREQLLEKDAKSDADIMLEDDNFDDDIPF